MYRCPKLVEVPAVVELPTVMYKMPTFNTTSDVQPGNTATQAAVSTMYKNGPEVSLLEARQEAVLRRLQTLKDQLDRLQSTRTTAAAAAAAATGGGGVASALGAAACSSPAKTAGSPIQEVVVSASPSAPPLSLLVLWGALAKAGLPVHSASRVHSSVTQVSPTLQEAFCRSTLGERSKHALAFSVQWTDTPVTSLMVNPLRQTKIQGEANLVRYLARMFPAASPFNYEATGTYTSIAEVDVLMDEAEKEFVFGDGKGRAATLRRVAARLAKSPFLCGGSCGVADVVVWSLLRQRGQPGSRSTKGQQEEVITHWMARMDGLAGVDMDGLTPTQENKQRQTPNNTNNKNTTPAPKGKEDEGKTQQLAPQGNKHLGRKELEAYLNQLAIPFQVKEHKEVFTVNELMDQVGGIPGVVTKNLFLRDKKKKLYLLSTRHNAEVDLKSIAKQIGTKDLRFADESILLDTLGVRQGCVSALALVNDVTGRLVQFLVDSSALEPTVPLVHFHPMSNAATLGLKPDELQKFLAAINHPATLVTLN